MRPKIQDLIDALERANELEGKRDFVEARSEIAYCIQILNGEDNRLRLKQKGEWK